MAMSMPLMLSWLYSAAGPLRGPLYPMTTSSADNADVQAANARTNIEPNKIILPIFMVFSPLGFLLPLFDFVVKILTATAGFIPQLQPECTCFPRPEGYSGLARRASRDSWQEAERQKARTASRQEELQIALQY
jgi:hypothetical protein